MIYCNPLVDACPNSRQYCAYGGYPDPSDCRGCICPDGFGGSECQDIEESHGKGRGLYHTQGCNYRYIKNNCN